MQIREELRQKGHDRSRKRCVGKEGKISFSETGGRINIVFGPKYRPLVTNEAEYSYRNT
jgi:hypothetical protein